MSVSSDLTINEREKYSPYSDGFIERDDITIVIPTLNEELAIGHVIEGLMTEGYFNLLLVDGYSLDETLKVARQYEVDIIHQHGNGKTGAIQTAIEHVKTPYLFLIDGDLTYDPKDIARFLPHLSSYDEIIGARTSGREHISKLNRLGNWVINKTFNLFFSTYLTDVCSGLYALKTDFAKDLVLDTQGFDVEVEIAAQAAMKGSITEVPISYGKRLGIQKLEPWKDGLKIMNTMFKLARQYNSVILYSTLVASTIIPSFIMLMWLAIEWFKGVWHSGIALVAFVMLLIGSQAITLSTIVSQQRRLEKKIIQKLNSEH